MKLTNILALILSLQLIFPYQLVMAAPVMQQTQTHIASGTQPADTHHHHYTGTWTGSQAATTGGSAPAFSNAQAISS